MLTAAVSAANITGVVLNDQGEVLIGASVYWANTTKGTATDLDGNFTLPTEPSTSLLVSSYIGYHNDTIKVSGKEPVTFVLVSNIVLDEVTIAARKAAVVRGRITPFDVQTIGSDELCKAACCNLSEAFETSAAVDVAYSDAATGAKTIKMLGLSGTYVQLLTENTPGVRGLAQNFGMEYIPGPWMSSIQVSKGTSSVLNGYESTTGQINVEYLKPQTQDPIAINVMLNSELHAEVNIEGGWQIPLKDADEHHHHDEAEEQDEDEHHHDEHCHHKSLYTGILAHYQNGFMRMDDNADRFLDMPLSQQLNLANRWFFKNGDYTFQAYVRGLYDRRAGGQMEQYSKSETDGTKRLVTVDNPYKIDICTNRIEGFIKNGYVFDEETGTSIGIQAAASYHDQRNLYGLREWNASQANAYLNAIFQMNFEGSESLGMDNDHRLSAGLSVNFDKYNETLSLPTFENIYTPELPFFADLSRYEVVPGIFAEYSLKIEEMLSLVAGVRADYSTQYGFFCTPRINVRYSPWEWWSIRASAGLGYRSPNVIADNAFMLPSSRIIHLDADRFGQERAVNTGLSTTFYIPLGSKELQLSAEYYFTNFMNCVVADLDQATNAIHLYNLRDVAGARSFAHNAQIEASMEILRGWTMTAAFRYTDVEQTTQNADGDYVLREKPFSKKFKGIITTSYQTPLKKWQFDLTAQFNGGGRMPDGFNNYFLNTLQSDQYVEKDGTLYYKWYPQLLAQITKYFRTCSLYVGAENMTNFKQDTPILGADDPYAPGFDASMAWGPITGWKVYAGFRWSLTKE